MRNIIKYISITLLMLLICSCEIDNYALPDGYIHGRIIDAGTGEPMPLPVEGSNGTVINLMEKNSSATLAHSFYAMQDGSYSNSMVVKGEYSITANGPFKLADSYEASIGSDTELDLYATPYSRISTDVQAEGKKVTVSFKVTPVASSDRVSRTYVMWNYRKQTDIISGNYCSMKADYTGKAEGSVVFNLENENLYNANIGKIKANGDRVYFRAAAEVSGNVNYSEVVELTIN